MVAVKTYRFLYSHKNMILSSLTPNYYDWIKWTQLSATILFGSDIFSFKVFFLFKEKIMEAKINLKISNVENVFPWWDIDKSVVYS